jgi:HK97 family phage prohead protease
MDSLAFKFELKELTEEGVFKGYASVFGNRDYGGDVVEEGAFAKTLKDRGGRIVLLDGHDTSQRLGVAYLSEAGRPRRAL